MRSLGLLCAAVGAAAVHDSSKGQWCMAPPVTGEWPHLDASKGVEFRGGFRDLSLYIHTQNARVAGCKDIFDHYAGNDGLWVLEFDTAAKMQTSMAKAKKKGLDIVGVQNQTYVMLGGEHVPDLMNLDACGSEIDMRLISVSSTNLRAPRVASSHYAQHYGKYITAPDASIAAVLREIREEGLKQDITTLQHWNSRNSNLGSQLGLAIDFLTERYEKAGAVVQTHKVRAGQFYDQISATFKGAGRNPKKVVIGAHADSRSTQLNSPTQRAPGADDNGSGTAALLAIANALSASGIKLQHDVVLVSFTGEEQGLVGSRAFADEYLKAGTEVVGMVNGDMLGYQEKGQPVRLAFMDKYASLNLTAAAKKVVGTYLPDLLIGDTKGCCSDQQSFHERGFPAVGLFEHPGSAVKYPQYHKSGDLLKELSTAQLTSETKAMLAIALVLAEPLE